MRRNKEYNEAIKQAPANYADLLERGDAAIGGTWDELEKQLLDEGYLTEEEIAASNLRVALIGELIKVRQEKNISQKKLEELSGVKQPVIARMERGITSPQIDTLIKLLVPLGKTLAIVPLDQDKQQ